VNDAYADADPVFKAVAHHWYTKLEAARKHKLEVFQKDADECMGFFNGPRSWDQMMGGKGGMASTDLGPQLAFKMSVNKAFEFVTIFGPALYYQNPVRTVTPRSPIELPMEFFADPYMANAIYMQQQQQLMEDGLRSEVIEKYLNWLPLEGDLAGQSRQAIEEALIKGRGCLWTELSTPPGTNFRVVASSFDTVDNLYVDPDAPSLEKATWIAKRCVHPVWQVERDYGLAPGTLKGNMESQAIQAEIAANEDAQFDRKRGLTNDLLVYWKIYSKMGIGGRLTGLPRRMRGPLEMFGDYTYMVVAKDVPFLLNLPPDVTEKAGSGDGGVATEVLDRVAWPTPFWSHGGWPVTCLDFHQVPNSPWPMAHLRAGLGELKFLNWAMSFIAGKIRNTCRDFIAVKKEAGEEIKTAILEGKDETILELEADHDDISKLVGFLQHPQMNGDVWKVIAAIEENFDKRVGLNELMYGSQGATQIRSAQEAQIRNSNMNVRPDDMSKQVEAWMAEVARKEAVCSRYHLTSSDISPVMGELAGEVWDGYVASQDLNTVTRQLDYRIEAGSTKKPNKDAQVQQMSEGMQVLLPIFQQYATMTGDMTPMNNLIADWAKSRDLNPARYQLSYAAPPPAPAAPGDPNAQAQGDGGDQFGTQQPAA
jgi:hypothetical protein